MIQWDYLFSVSRSLVCVCVCMGGGFSLVQSVQPLKWCWVKTENENRQKTEMKSECISRMLLFTHLHAVVNEWECGMHKYHCRCSVIRVLSLALSLFLLLSLIHTHTEGTGWAQIIFIKHDTSIWHLSMKKKERKKKTLKQSEFWLVCIRAPNTFSMGLAGASSLYLSSFQRWVENTERFGGWQVCVCETVKIRQIP